MVKITKLLRNPLLLLLVGAIIISFAFPGALFSTVTPTGEVIQLATPRYGNSICREEITQTDTGLRAIPIDGILIGCGVERDESTDKCEISFKPLDKSPVEGFFGNPIDNVLYYQICDSQGFNCGSEKALSVKNDFRESSQSTSFIESSPITIQEQQTIKAQFWDNTIAIGTNIGNKDEKIDGMQYRSKYRRKFLEIENSFNELRGVSQNGYGCDISESYNIPSGGFFGVIKEDTGQDAPTGPSKNIGEEQRVNGVNNWVERWVIDTTFDSQLVNIGNDRFFCKVPGALYSLAEAEYTIGGRTTSYVYPDQFIRQTECCLGQTTSTQSCQLVGDTLKFVDTSPENLQCVSDLDCPGTGDSFLPNPDEPTQERTFVCASDNTCKVDRTRTVECNLLSPCGSGEFCGSDGTCKTPTGGAIPIPDGCPAGTEYVQKTTESCEGRILCEIGITNPTITKEDLCVQKFNFLPLVVGTIIILLALTTGLGVRAFRGRKRKR